MRFIKSTLFLLGLISLFHSPGIYALVHPIDEVPSKTKSKLYEGHIHTVETETKRGPWPMIDLYLVINARPEQATAIFAAYDYQEKYVPNMLVSKVTSQPTSLEVITDYEIDLPWPLSTSKYTQKNSLSLVDGSAFKVAWEGIKSDSTKENVGYALFYPLEHDGKKLTLLKYHSFVHPDSFFAPILKGKMLRDVKKSIEAIRNHIEELSSSKSTILDKYLDILVRSIRGESVYRISNKK